MLYLKGINKDLFIEDVTGKRYPAHKIFTISIKAMVGHFREFLKKTNLSEIRLDDIKWVLTVPAIWSDAAKKFMRQCATDVSEQKKLCLHSSDSSIKLCVLLMLLTTAT